MSTLIALVVAGLAALAWWWRRSIARTKAEIRAVEIRAADTEIEAARADAQATADADLETTLAREPTPDRVARTIAKIKRRPR